MNDHPHIQASSFEDDDTIIPLYQIPIQCPSCGQYPRIRFSAYEIRRWRFAHPRIVVQTYRCHWRYTGGRSCNQVYPIRAAAFQQKVRRGTQWLRVTEI